VIREVACPRCGKKAPFTPDNAWRPFCSERCKMIDLGAWAEERYRVPVESGPDDDAADLKDRSQ
jgi:endogenous inhibitor of DNA gyrase (YacG/DUF329 family)